MDALVLDPQLSSEASESPPDSTDLHAPAHPAKRSATDAGLQSNAPRPPKSVKRRASKACQCCRARKVRCNVVEHGPPCTNCRLDEVECIVSESKRKKKWITPSNGVDTTATIHQQHSREGAPSFKSTAFPMSARPPYQPLKRPEHVPHALYQDLGRSMSLSTNSQPRPAIYPTPDILMNLQRLGLRPSSSDPTSLLPPPPPPPPSAPMVSTPVTPSYSLPLYIKPLPSKLDKEDILYLEQKGALTLPSPPLRDELLRNFVEFVYPYMPLVNLHELIGTIDRDDGLTPISLLLFQAIMFSAIATVDTRFLRATGYASRRDARRSFFQKTRVLYDFDIEVDRISLIQSLLLMTFWYETPDDQKDSHHWMGIAVSLSHTIGLHRNPEKSAAMDASRKKLWKRIWWSTYTRDRLVALGMRRPTRIKTADFDVPMLTINDFEIEVLPEGPSCVPKDCRILRDADVQRQLAVMCIEKVRLCVCMSHVLSVQYSVLNNNHGVVSEEGSTSTTARLSARTDICEQNEVEACDRELQVWREELPAEANYDIPSWRDIDSGNESVVVNRSLLHMVYFATLSALHRPQVLPSTTTPPRPQLSEMLDQSRKAVRLAANEITSIAYGLYNLDLVRYLPTTGITVLLPAIIIHLLDIKAIDEQTRRSSLQGFCQCMQVMGRLRDIYAAADYSTAFLEAAIRKAEITLPQRADEVKEPRNVITSAQGLVDAGRRMQLVAAPPPPAAVTAPALERSALTTPPPDEKYPPRESDSLSEDDIARKLNSYLASTPPYSEQPTGSESADVDTSTGTTMMGMQPDFEPDFDSLLNLDAAGDGWSLEDGAYAAMSGESGGFTMDMDWSKALRDDGLEGSSTIAASC